MIESEPLQDGRNMVMMLGPVKQALPKKDDDEAEAVEGPTSLASLAGDIVDEPVDEPVAEEAVESGRRRRAKTPPRSTTPTSTVRRPSSGPSEARIRPCPR